MIKIIDGSLYQWDTGRYVTITVKNGESISEVHCYNRGDKEALVVETRFKDSSIVAPIPNILLQSARELIVCVMRENGNGEQTEEKASFHIIERAKPSDYVYTETEVKRWEDLEKRVNDTLANWETDAIDRVSEAALEAATEAFNDELAALKQADEDNATALSELRTEYETALEELQKADGDNATAIRELTKAYNTKVAEFEKAIADNKKAIEDHIEAYNKKVIELDKKSNNASLAASNAQTSAVAAQTAATNAQNSANEAQKTANNAVEAANAAQDTANNALGIVNKAHNKAVEAQNTIDEEIARAKAAEKANSDAIELLTNGISVEEIDGVKDLIKYTNEHGAEVTQMQTDISSNKKAIEETSTELAKHKSAYNEKAAAIDALNANQQNYLDYLNGVESEGLDIQISEDGQSAKVMGVGTFRGENLVIPSYHQGVPVTTIEDGAFKYNSVHTPKRIKLPETVTHIVGSAFQENSATEEVILPNSLRHIGVSAFEYFYGKSLIIPKSVETIDGYAFRSSGVTLYIEAESKPEGWANDWGEMHTGKVVWGYTPDFASVSDKISQLKKSDEANAKALEDYIDNFNLENGNGEGSLQIKGGNAQGKNSTDLSESVEFTLAGDAYTTEYLQANFNNSLSDEDKQSLFPVKRVACKTFQPYAYDITDIKVITFGDGSYVVPLYYGYEWDYFSASGERLIAFGDDPSDDTENLYYDVNTWIKSIEVYSSGGIDSGTGNDVIFSIFDDIISVYGEKVERTGALADNTFTAGIGTKATIKGQTALGAFNEVDDDALVMFGCGTEDAPENAVKIMKDGSVWVKADLSQLTSGSVLTIVDGILKAQPFGVGNAKHSFVVRDSGMRSTIQTPASGNSGAYQIANRIYVDKKVGGSTSISISAGGSKVIKLSCTDHEGSRTDIPRGLYNGTGIYVIYSNSSSTIEIINEKGEAVEVNGKFILLSVTPHSTTDAGIRVCALYYNSIVDVGWKTAYTVLGKTITIKAASDTTAMVQYHQISPFRTDFPT